MTAALITLPVLSCQQRDNTVLKSGTDNKLFVYLAIENVKNIRLHVSKKAIAMGEDPLDFIVQDEVLEAPCEATRTFGSFVGSVKCSFGEDFGVDSEFATNLSQGGGTFRITAKFADGSVAETREDSHIKCSRPLFQGNHQHKFHDCQLEKDEEPSRDLTYPVKVNLDSATAAIQWQDSDRVEMLTDCLYDNNLKVKQGGGVVTPLGDRNLSCAKVGSKKLLSLYSKEDSNFQGWVRQGDLVKGLSCVQADYDEKNFTHLCRASDYSPPVRIALERSFDGENMVTEASAQLTFFDTEALGLTNAQAELGCFVIDQSREVQGAAKRSGDRFYQCSHKGITLSLSEAQTFAGDLEVELKAQTYKSKVQCGSSFSGKTTAECSGSKASHR